MTDAGVRILVVDDNEDNRYTLTRRLQREGWTDLATAENGREALTLVAKERFDLVLLDIMMPEINGYEVLKQLKTDPATRDIPVLMISALSEFESVVRCIELGAEDYLPKPFNPALLRARVRACLEKKRLHDQELSYLTEIDHQRRRAEALLHAILPSQAVDELEQSQTVSPRRHEDVVVFFADIVGFTAYCDLLAPEEIVANLDVYASTFEDIASHHGLEKIKTSGDGYMVVGGAPVARPDHAAALARLALAMRDATQALRDPTGHPVPVRIGLASGPVVRGVIGTRKFFYDVWGDAVNVASRMETTGLPGMIQVSDDIYRRLKDAFEFEERGARDVKGKGVMQTWLLLRAKAKKL